MLAAMLRQSTATGSGGGGGSGGTKLSMGISRFSSSSGSSASNAILGQRVPKGDPVSPEGSDVPASDPNYIMQLVSDVRKFADALLQLKDVFNSKGNVLKDGDRMRCALGRSPGALLPCFLTLFATSVPLSINHADSLLTGTGTDLRPLYGKRLKLLPQKGTSDAVTHTHTQAHPPPRRPAVTAAVPQKTSQWHCVGKVGGGGVAGWGGVGGGRGFVERASACQSTSVCTHSRCCQHSHTHAHTRTHTVPGSWSQVCFCRSVALAVRSVNQPYLP